MEGLIMTAQLILAISILVGVHELGHLISAKWFGMKAEKFFIGFPPKLFSFRWGETEYGLGAIPLGGFVKVAGMVDESLDTRQLKSEPEPWEFRAKPAWQRLIVMLGGIIVNVFTGVVIFISLTYYAGESYISADQINDKGIIAYTLGEEVGFRTGDKILSVSGKPFTKDSELFTTDVLLSDNAYYIVERKGQQVRIDIPHNLIEKLSTKNAASKFIGIHQPFFVDRINPGSPAEKAGLKSGDIIMQVGDVPTPQFPDLQKALLDNAGKTVMLVIQRNGDQENLSAVIGEDGKLGFYPGSLLKAERRAYSIGEAMYLGTSKSFTILFDQIRAFGKMFKGDISVQKSLSGPIGIAQVFGGTWSWVNFWTITGLLSMALAFMNLLPIPALDGGHVMFILFEMISGRKPSEKFLEYAQRAGMILLLGLMVFAFYNDIARLFS